MSPSTGTSASSPAEGPRRPDILFFGDPHGEFEPIVTATLALRPPAIILLGDIEPARPLEVELEAIVDLTEIWWIPGNHDTDSERYFDNLWGTGLAHRNLHGRVVEVAGYRVAGLGGVFRDQVWNPDQGLGNHHFESRAALKRHARRNKPLTSWREGLPLRHHSTIFPEEYMQLIGQRADILVTHEAPAAHRYGWQALDVLASELGAQLHVHGHHHQNIDYEAEGLLAADASCKVYGVDKGHYLAWPEADPRFGTVEQAHMRRDRPRAPWGRGREAVGPKIGRIPSNRWGRDYVVGDIHGCFSWLQEGLDAIGFDSGIDRLFSLGDMVDRGPESHRVLEWLDKPWFFAVQGNHEFMTWRVLSGDPYRWVDHRHNGGEWVDALSAAERQEICLRLQALPLTLEVDTLYGVVGLMHADCPWDDWTDLQKIDWAQEDLENGPGYKVLWSPERLARGYAGPVRNIRAVVHGHSTVREPVLLGNVWHIDTGGWKQRHRFTFLELETLKPVFRPQPGQPSEQGGAA